MKHYSLRHIVTILAVMAGLLLALRPGSIAAQGPDLVVISNPADGATVSGIVTVTGAIDFPDFVKYELYLKTGDQMIWGATVYSPVINGNLAKLDTRIFMDGTYQLVVRKVRSDSNYDEFMGPTFTIANELGAPLPFPEVDSSLLYPPFAGSLLRIRNCGGSNLEFDYTSPKGFCSHDNLWIMGKSQEEPLCTTVDALVISGCEYRGTAFGEGSGLAINYSFNAEHGKIYDIVYPGNKQLYINEIPGDERAETDTGGLDISNPDRAQTVEEILGAGDKAMADQASAPATGTESGAMMVAGEDPASPAEESETALPVSGQAAPQSQMIFMVVAIVFILFMVGGGVLAMRRDKQAV